MSPTSLLRRSYEKARQSPLARRLRQERHARAFAAGRGHFFGVFDTFDAARAAAPKTQPFGFEEDAPGALYRDRLDRVFPSDYPALFWMKGFLDAKPESRVFDFGGHVGIAHYSYERYFGGYDAALRWTVYDMPSVTKAGAALATSRGVHRLGFTNRLEDADGADLMLASGSIQYMDTPSFGAYLRSLRAPPQRVVVNRTPLADGPSFVTLQNIRVSFCPYRIFDGAAFVADIESAGYRVVDTWECPEHRCILPLDPARSVPAYRGICFDRVTG